MASPWHNFSHLLHPYNISLFRRTASDVILQYSDVEVWRSSCSKRQRIRLDWAVIRRATNVADAARHHPYYHGINSGILNL
eukprot:scaffold39712_cov205-Skeletonema_dohrnii-CCMP3373.AAC.1